MRTLTVTMSVTLDGVTQSLGRPDEDTRDGFTAGGWGPRYVDEVLQKEMGRGMSQPGDMLLGHRTWRDFAGYWPKQPANPVTDHLNATKKYVVSRTGVDTHEWANSDALIGDAATTVAELKAEGDRPLSVVGSVALVQALHRAGLVDGYTLLIHPLVIGRGRRLFEDVPLTEFTLERSVPTTKGVIVATYVK